MARLHSVVLTALLICGAAALKSSCIVLDATTPCGPAFTGYPVDAEQFDNLTSFSELMSSRYMDPVQATSFFAETYGCDSNSIAETAPSHLRYDLSFWCSSFVFDAINAGCNVSSLPTTTISEPDTSTLSTASELVATRSSPEATADHTSSSSTANFNFRLCHDECVLANNTVASLLTNTTACPKRGVSRKRILARQDALEQYASTCNDLQPKASCIHGAPNEIAACGFASIKAATTGCVWIIDTDADLGGCCKTLLAAIQSNNTAIGPEPTSTVRTTASAPTHIADAIPLSSGNDHLNTILLIICVAAALLVLICSLVVGILACHRKARRQKRMSQSSRVVNRPSIPPFLEQRPSVISTISPLNSDDIVKDIKQDMARAAMPYQSGRSFSYESIASLPQRRMVSVESLSNQI